MSATPGANLSPPLLRREHRRLGLDARIRCGDGFRVVECSYGRGAPLIQVHIFCRLIGGLPAPSANGKQVGCWPQIEGDQPRRKKTRTSSYSATCCQVFALQTQPNGLRERGSRPDLPPGPNHLGRHVQFSSRSPPGSWASNLSADDRLSRSLMLRNGLGKILRSLDEAQSHSRNPALRTLGKVCYLGSRLGANPR